jgi:hypothetical protein
MPIQEGRRRNGDLLAQRNPRNITHSSAENILQLPISQNGVEAANHGHLFRNSPSRTSSLRNPDLSQIQRQASGLAIRQLDRQNMPLLQCEVTERGLVQHQFPAPNREVKSIENANRLSILSVFAEEKPKNQCAVRHALRQRNCRSCVRFAFGKLEDRNQSKRIQALRQQVRKINQQSEVSWQNISLGERFNAGKLINGFSRFGHPSADAAAPARHEIESRSDVKLSASRKERREAERTCKLSHWNLPNTKFAIFPSDSLEKSADLRNLKTTSSKLTVNRRPETATMKSKQSVESTAIPRRLSKKTGNSWRLC